MLRLSLIFISACFASAAFADAPLAISERVLQTKDGTHSYVLSQYVNEFGGLEIQVEHQEVRSFLPDTRNVVLWGRDTDGDRKFDAWFYHGESGVIEAWDLRSHEPDGWDAAQKVLRLQVRAENRWMAAVVFGSLAETISLTRGKQNEFWKKLTRDQMYLRDLEIRANRIFAANRAAPGLTQHYELIASGWAELSGEGVSTALKQNFQHAAGDLGLYITGAALVKGIGFGAKWTAGKVMSSPAGELIESLYARYLAGLVARAGDSMELLRLRRAEIQNAVGETVVAARSVSIRASAVQRASIALRAMEQRGAIGRLASRQLRATYGVGTAMTRRLPYMGLVQSTQILAEVGSRPEDLFDPNPIVLSSKLFADQDFMQNFMFMSRETLLLATVSEYDNKVRRRMLVCGLLSLGNSGITTYMYNDDGVDAGRVTLDTSWEVIVGNTQTQLDIKALQYFENMAARSNNPRYKLIGYAVALVEQTVGYFGYSKVTEWYEGSRSQSRPAIKPTEVRLIPILLEQTATSSP